MNAEALAASIIEDARRKAKELERETRERITRYEHETQRIREERERKALERARKERERDRARKEAQARRAVRLEELRAKQHELDDAFERARRRLEELSGDERHDLLERLWRRACESMDVASVIPAERDAGFFDGRAEVLDVCEGIGGFIAVSEDVRLDLRFETLIAWAREHEIEGVAQTLFGG